MKINKNRRAVRGVRCAACGVRCAVRGLRCECIIVVDVSPPFEGGVALFVDYEVNTKIISGPGWLIL